MKADRTPRLNADDDNLAPFIRLVMRSADVGDGWRNVSQTLRNFVSKSAAQWPDLFETRELAGMQIRLSEKGKLLAEYVA
jgi:uncharacterized protein (DUF736 family)